MPYAAYLDTGYKIMLVLHIVTAMAAFAPAFVHPIVTAQSRGMDSTSRSALLTSIAGNGRKIYAPALLVTGILGFGVAGMSKMGDELVWKMSQGWLVSAVVIWVAMNGILHAVIMPSERRLADGDEAAQKKLDLGGGIMSVLLVVMLYLMVFKPGTL